MVTRMVVLNREAVKPTRSSNNIKKKKNATQPPSPALMAREGGLMVYLLSRCVLNNFFSDLNQSRYLYGCCALMAKRCR